MSESESLSEAQRLHVVDEAMKALRLSRRYGGQFSQDEFDYARILLEELEKEAN